MNKKLEASINRDDAKSKFRSAYTIHGRGVGKLELSKAMTSVEFRRSAKELVRKIHISYPQPSPIVTDSHNSKEKAN